MKYLFLFFTVCLFVQADIADADSKLTDNQIVKIILTLNEQEIATGSLAANRAQNANVKSFAQDMINAHKNNLNIANEIITENNLIPTDSEVNRGLSTDENKENSVLNNLINKETNILNEDSNFDKAFIEEQIIKYKKDMSILNEDLVPNAINSNLKSLLESIKNITKRQLMYTQNLRDRLNITRYSSMSINIDI